MLGDQLLGDQRGFSHSLLLALLIIDGTVGGWIRLIRHQAGLGTLGVDASFAGRTGAVETSGMAQGKRWQGEDANEKCEPDDQG